MGEASVAEVGKVKVRPVGCQILVRQDEAADKTAGGIVIPDLAKERPKQGTVLAIGRKVEECATGDRIIFSKYAGAEAKVDEEELQLIDERDVLAVIELAKASS